MAERPDAPISLPFALCRRLRSSKSCTYGVLHQPRALILSCEFEGANFRKKKRQCQFGRFVGGSRRGGSMLPRYGLYTSKFCTFDRRGQESTDQKLLWPQYSATKIENSPKHYALRPRPSYPCFVSALRCSLSAVPHPSVLCFGASRECAAIFDAGHAGHSVG